VNALIAAEKPRKQQVQIFLQSTPVWNVKKSIATNAAMTAIARIAAQAIILTMIRYMHEL
jgi:hypothetical protein